MTSPDPDLLESVRLAREATSSRAAARELLNRVALTVRRVVVRLAGLGEADNLIADTLVTILRTCGSYKGRGSLEAWAAAIAFRVTMRGLKRLRRNQKTVRADAHIEQRIASQPNDLPGGELSERMRLHLTRLPVDQAEAIVLRVVMGYSIDEVAEIVGAKRNTVRGRVRLGLAGLRRSVGRDPTMLELAGRREHDGS